MKRKRMKKRLPRPKKYGRNLKKKKILNLQTELDRVNDEHNNDKQYFFSLTSRRYPEDYCLFVDSLAEKLEWLDAIISWMSKDFVN